MSDPFCISILLATYNGAAYLSEQLDSLFAQTNRDWRLLVRDDCSTDATAEILAAYQAKYPGIISIAPNDGVRLGACRNFGMLLEYAEAPYVMFCDQDDVWLPDKIEVTLAAMKWLEAEYGTETPLLVHTDLKVVDERLCPLGNSLWQYMGSTPARLTGINRVLMQNFATGCTVMINRSLRDLANPVPDGARMHDWWFALVATAFGKVTAVDGPTILYRQHGKNDSGAVHWNFVREVIGFIDRERRNAAITKRDAIFTNLEQQAAAFADRYGARLDRDTRLLLSEFCSLRQRGFFMRRFLTLRYGFLYSNRLANLGMLLFR